MQIKLKTKDRRSTRLTNSGSKQTNYANPVEAGQYFITKSSVVMQERKASMRRKDTSPRFDADAAVIGLLTQGVQIGPVLDVVVLKASQLFEIEVRVPSRSPEHRSSCVRVCQDAHHHAHRKVVDDDAGANLFSLWQPSSLRQPSSSLQSSSL